MTKYTGGCWHLTFVSYPMVILERGGAKYRGLLDTGTRVPCASEALLNQLKIGPSAYNTKKIKTMTDTTDGKIYKYVI